ncbi:hypothetical protein AJ79_08356 [Helicocarpus griseus UAMH5409]|uniref:Uncharacterized protein n=1 Tax=Helicocarpus griseus UAMH5409 TaxID=1447875 RepID=A0A2B7WTJ2_9EURO|nr:hypothetical protein AJ79_08356 [Helicocarpus griseus UAMH5409]
MPDIDESASHSSSHHPHHPHHPPLLQFPKLPATSQDNNNNNAMTSDGQSDRPGSSLSLSESWATMSASDIYSEDGSRSDQTDVASLIGRSVPDDVTSLSEGRDTDDSEDDSSSVNVHSYCSDNEPPPPLPRHIREQQRLDDSKSTVRPPYQPVSDSIEFVEPDNWPDVETIELKHTIQVYNEDETPDFLRTLPHDLGDGHLSVTVQQTMAKRGLDLTKPFRALYVGHPDFKHIILDIMGDVLVAGSEDSFNSDASGDSSRFHVVPASFGTGTSPNYAELLPIHVQLIVDECVSVSAKKEHHNKPDTINLTLKNREPCSSTWTGSGYEVQSDSPWTLPDLAIFFMSQDDNLTARKIRSLCHTFMKRHGVPCMVISENPLWTKLNSMVPLDYQSLHICLESRDKETGESRVLGRYPIDLKTFESIAPGQLNRNLASLSGLSTSKAVPKAAEVSKMTEMLKPSETPSLNQGRMPWLLDIEDLPDGSSRIHFLGASCKIETILRGACTAIALLIGTLLMTMGYAMLCALVESLFVTYAKLPSMSITSRFYGPASTTTSLAASTTATSTAETSLMRASINELILPGCTENDSFDVDAYLSKLASPTDKQANEPDKYQVHIIGDCHIIIKMPSRLASRRRVPKFDVRINRADRQIPFDRACLFDGIYTLRLAREDAYGPLNVSITTKSKPVIEQVTEVDFGTPWLKIANWKKAAQELSFQLRKDLNAAQAGLSDAYSRVFTDLHEMSDTLRTEAESAGSNTMQRALKATGLMLAKSKQLSEVIKKRTRNSVMASSTSLCETLSTANRGALQVWQSANEGWFAVEREAKRLFQKPAYAYDFNLTSRLACSAKRAKKSPGMATAQKQATSLWQRLIAKAGSKSGSDKKKTRPSKCGKATGIHYCGGA